MRLTHRTTTARASASRQESFPATHSTGVAARPTAGGIAGTTLKAFLLATLMTMALVVLPGMASAQTPTKDTQVYNCGNGLNNNSGYFLNSTMTDAYTFTASKTTTITRVDPILSGSSNTVADARFELRTVDPATGNPTNTVLGSTTIPKEEIAVASANRAYETGRFGEGGVPVVAGTKYALSFNPVGSGELVWWGLFGNPCSDTLRYQSRNGGAFAQDGTHDAFFRLFESVPATLPVAVADKYDLNEDVTLNVNAPGVLANDTDADGDALSAVLETGTQNGNLTLNPNGSFVYKPNTNFNGSDSFTYRAKDVDGNSEPATVTLTVAAVNDAPVANNDTANVAEDGSVNITVLTNDTDADGPGQFNPASVGISNLPSNGMATANADGTITYKPKANFNGSDSFEYKVCDGGSPALCDTATVNVTVPAVNDAPVANNDDADVNEDGSADIAVLSNDTDADGNGDIAPTSVRVVTPPEKGTATANTDGTITYDPNPDFNGSDSFIYEVCDKQGACDTATVTVRVAAVNDTPVARDDLVSTSEDTPIAIQQSELLSNDDDGAANESQPLSITEVKNPVNGTVVLNNDGTITFTPEKNYNGNGASFDYTVTDGQGNTSTATANVKVTVTAVNDAPVAEDDSATTDEDTPANINVIPNDTDVDNANAELSVSSFTQPSNGTVTQNADGTLTYAPDGDFNGTDSFTYEVCDDGDPALCATATVTMTVSPVPDACTIKGTGKDDVLRGTAGRDVICGGGGNDTVYGRGGNDLIRGGAGQDTVHGDAGDDTLHGGDGGDKLYGDEGDDRLYGGAGTDLLNGGTGQDTTQQ